jgi:ElaB/YqjD/DUF883 family membrane-anchored ribosome-binding protein
LEATLGGAKSAREQLREQAATVADDLRKLGRISQEAAKDVASEYLDAGKHKLDEVEDRVVSYIRAKPVKSVLIATGAGLLLGYLFSRR